MKQALINTVLIVAISFASLYTYHYFYKPKTAFVDIKKVFNSFQMKKELEEKYKQTERSRDKILDTMMFKLQILSKQIKENKENKELAAAFDVRREEYLKAKRQFAEDNGALSQKYDGQIFEQITQYVMEYGKKNNYDFIYGTDGNGNLMFASDKHNVSDEVIVYINNKYKGLE